MKLITAATIADSERMKTGTTSSMTLVGRETVTDASLFEAAPH